MQLITNFSAPDHKFHFVFNKRLFIYYRINECKMERGRP